MQAGEDLGDFCWLVAVVGPGHHLCLPRGKTGDRFVDGGFFGMHVEFVEVRAGLPAAAERARDFFSASGLPPAIFPDGSRPDPRGWLTDLVPPFEGLDTAFLADVEGVVPGCALFDEEDDELREFGLVEGFERARPRPAAWR